MGGEERVERQHASGRLTVRERIERLFDPGSFHETGALAGRATYSDGRRAGGLPAGQHDRRAGARSRAAARSSRATTSPFAAAPPTPRSGPRRCSPSAWPTTCACRSSGSSTARAEAAASRRSSRWASRTCRRCRGSSSWSENLSIVPVAAAALGPCAGLGAARVVCSHFSVIVKGSAQLFVAGPPVVAMAGMGEIAGQGGARRGAHAGEGRSGRQRGGRRGRRARAAQALPLLPAGERLGGAAARAGAPTLPTAATPS